MLLNIKIKPKQGMDTLDAVGYTSFLERYGVIPYLLPRGELKTVWDKLKLKHNITHEFVVDANITILNSIFSLSKKGDSQNDIWSAIEEVTITKIDVKKEIAILKQKNDDLKDELVNSYSKNLIDVQNRERKVKEDILS